jgi:hypothetical protein
MLWRSVSRSRLSRSRGALLAGLLVALVAAPAHAQPTPLPVVVVSGLDLADLEDLVDRGAVGLLVPGSGPRISEQAALAGLERGAVRSSFRGGLPSGPVLIDVERADELPGGPAIVLSLPEGGDQENETRYPIAVLADGYGGLLTSDSTRVPGLVSLVDVAPTALGLADRSLRSTPSDHPVAALVALDRRISDNANARAVGALIAGLLILVLAATRPRAALLAFSTTLLANLALGAGGVSEPWVVWLVLALGAGLVAPALATIVRSPLAVGLVLAFTVAAYLLALAVDLGAVALSPLGPTQVSRFYGLSNLLSALLLVPALSAAALLQVELGWLAAAGTAAVSLVTVAGSSFGADGGTAVVLVVAYVVLGLQLVEGRRRRTAGLVASAVVGAVALLIALDATIGATSHLTEAVGGGPAGLADDLRDRVVLSWERATDRWYYALLTAAAALVLAGLLVRLVAVTPSRHERALPLALGVATLVSLLANDSPLDVVAAGLTGYLTVLAYVRADRPFGRTDTSLAGALPQASVET